MGKKNNGFTLIEAIVSLAILGIISVVCLNVLTFALSAKSKNDITVKEQVALRQALLTITSEIRKEPNNNDSSGPITERYTTGTLTDGMLKRLDGSVIAKDIKSFNIEFDDETNPSKVIITIESINKQKVTTTIHLRIGI